MARANTNTPLIQDLQERVIDLSAQWSIMKNEFEDMKKQQNSSALKIDRILQLLENDESTGSKGIVQQVRENSSYISDSKNYVKFAGIIAGAIGSIGMSILIKFAGG
jgi:hypothetical protein